MTKKKICLVVPNFEWSGRPANTLYSFFPYGVSLLAAVLEKDYMVSIIDANIGHMTQLELEAAIRKENPWAVGVSVFADMFSQSGHTVTAIVKKINPEIITVMGGAYVTTNPKRVLKDANVDYIIIGEGEISLPGLFNALAAEWFTALPAGAYGPDDEETALFERGSIPEDLDSLPFPAYHLLDFEIYNQNINQRFMSAAVTPPYARIITSRGCPQRCIFCQIDAIAGRKFRARSASSVLKEIQWLKDNYHIKSLIVDDDNFFVSKKRAVEVLQGMIDQQFNIEWKILNAAVFHIDDEIMALLHQSGCDYLSISIESGVERVLKEIIKKPAIDFIHVRHVVNKAREYGMFTAANFVIGFPGESWNEIRDTIRCAEELDLDYIRIFVATPQPNTELYRLAMDTHSLIEGFNPEDIEWKKGWIATDQFVPRDLQILRAYEWDRINFSLPQKRERIARHLGMSLEELWELRKSTLAQAIVD